MLARENLIKYGANALAEYELLAIILGVGSSGENVFDLSMRLIKKYSNLPDLLSLTYEELIKKAIPDIKVVFNFDYTLGIHNISFWFPLENFDPWFYFLVLVFKIKYFCSIQKQKQKIT